MTFVSLFTGIGGFDLGFERAGMTCLMQIESDKQCQSVLEKHWKFVHRRWDVNDDEAIDTLCRQRPDIICGGFPCQDVSVAGKRAGLAGDRSGLWFRFRDIIAVARPRWVCIENVPGLCSSWPSISQTPRGIPTAEEFQRRVVLEEASDFYAVTEGLSELGYWWAWRTFDSQYFGVAQRRRRVFIVGCLGVGSVGLPVRVLFESESVRGNSPPRRETVAKVAEAISGGAHPGGHNGQDDMNVVTHTLRSEGFDGSEDGTGRGVPLVAFGGNNISGPIQIATDCNAHGGTGRHDFESETFVTYAIQERAVSENTKNGPQGKGFQEGLGFTLEARHQQQSVAYRTTGNNGVFETGDKIGALNCATDPNQQIVNVASAVRRLTLRECERLQAFPDDWTRWGADGKEISNSARYRILGNAVTVNVAEWIGRRIMEVTS